LIYINDLEKGIKSSVKFFADDTSLFSIVTDPILSATELNHDLRLIEDWAFQWKMSFNPDPSKQAIEMLFSQKKKKTVHPHLYFNNQIVRNVTDHKHLGLVLDSKLTFTKHINEKIGIARKGIGMIKFLSRYVPLNTLNQIYKMYIRPHLDYCDVIYHIPSKLNPFESSENLNCTMQLIESTQYQAALAVSGTWKGTNKKKLYNELGWESLDNRRNSRRLCQFYKIYNNLTPVYLKTPIPAPKQYSNLRTNKPLNVMKCRTCKFSNSFYPDSVSVWNDTSDTIRNITSVTKFKSTLFNIIRPKPRPIFGIHDPKNIRILLQLRVGLSPLKHHKKCHKFQDTPSEICDCGLEAEDTIHFFTKCIFFTNFRTSLNQKTANLLSNLLPLTPSELSSIFLYGSSQLSNTQNQYILKASIEFINDTGRFN
jgi:hypothetical protein